MTIRIKEKLRRDLKKASHAMGVKEDELVDRALLLYLESIRNIIALKQELKAWDGLSDEAMERMALHLQSPL